MNRLTMPTVPVVCGLRGAGWMALLAWLAAASALASPGNGNSAATITGSFADSCRDFTAHSSKDISHVDLHYAGGSVVKDETINSPDWAIDGGPGEELDFALVKSGTTTEQFDCVASNAAPTALLEIQTPPIVPSAETCDQFWDGGLACEVTSPRTAWTNESQIPDTGGSEAGLFHWIYLGVNPLPQSSWTMTFRGTGSSDPDGDLVSWSLDFSDGTSVSGTWSSPPAEVTHEYASFLGGCTGVFNGIPNICTVALTVTDSAGQSATDTLPIGFVDLTPN